jgi:hypothetical protein
MAHIKTELLRNVRKPPCLADEGYVSNSNAKERDSTILAVMFSFKSRLLAGFSFRQFCA